MKVPHLQFGISDAALMAASEETEWRGRTSPTPQICGLPSGYAGYDRSRRDGSWVSSGRLFLDSIEQAMAVALVSSQAVRDRPVRISRGGLAPARLRR